MAPSARVTPHSVGRCREATEGPGPEGLRPQAVGERTVRLSEIFRAMARFSPSAPSGHRSPSGASATSPVSGESVSQREVFRHAGLPPRGCARRRVSERNRRRRLLARRLKLSPQATDEGKVCHYNPFKGNFRKLAPHPALRATFPRRGRRFHFSKYVHTASSASRPSRWPRLYRSSSLFSSPSNRPIVIGSCGRTQQMRPSASSSSS